MLVFDDGNFSEDSTFLLTDYLAHTPRDILAKNFRVDARTFDTLSQHGNNQMFQRCRQHKLTSFHREIYLPRLNSGVAGF